MKGLASSPDNAVNGSRKDRWHRVIASSTCTHQSCNIFDLEKQSVKRCGMGERHNGRMQQSGCMGLNMNTCLVLSIRCWSHSSVDDFSIRCTWYYQYCAWIPTIAMFSFDRAFHSLIHNINRHIAPALHYTKGTMLPCQRLRVIRRQCTKTISLARLAHCPEPHSSSLLQGLIEGPL